MIETCEECGLREATATIDYEGIAIAVCFACKAKDREMRLLQGALGERLP